MIQRDELIQKLKEQGYLENKQNILYLCKNIRIRLDHKWDSVVAVTGDAGSGKSCLTLIMDILIDNHFDINKNVSFIPKADEVRTTFNTLHAGSVFHIDEAIKSLFKQKWYEKVQQTIVEMYATERYKRICTFLLMPRFQDFTESFRHYRINLWIWVVDRGTAIVYMRDKDKDIKDPWHTDENIKIKSDYFGKKSVIYKTTEELLKAERKTPNYAFDFKFPDYADIDKDGYKLYEELKVGSRIEPETEEKISKIEKKYKIYLMKLVTWIRQRMKVSYGELGEAMGVNGEAIPKWFTKDAEMVLIPNTSSLLYINRSKNRPKTI